MGGQDDDDDGAAKWELGSSHRLEHCLKILYMRVECGLSLLINPERPVEGRAGHPYYEEKLDYVVEGDPVNPGDVRYTFAAERATRMTCAPSAPHPACTYPVLFQNSSTKFPPTFLPKPARQAVAGKST